MVKLALPKTETRIRYLKSKLPESCILSDELIGDLTEYFSFSDIDCLISSMVTCQLKIIFMKFLRNFQVWRAC